MISQTLVAAGLDDELWARTPRSPSFSSMQMPSDDEFDEPTAPDEPDSEPPSRDPPEELPEGDDFDNGN